MRGTAWKNDSGRIRQRFLLPHGLNQEKPAHLSLNGQLHEFLGSDVQYFSQGSGNFAQSTCGSQTPNHPTDLGNHLPTQKARGFRQRFLTDILGQFLPEVVQLQSRHFARQLFNEIRARGCSDILIAVTDGLKGMTKAIETVYPKTMHQTCIVHLLRNSTAFVSYIILLIRKEI